MMGKTAEKVREELKATGTSEQEIEQFTIYGVLRKSSNKLNIAARNYA